MFDWLKDLIGGIKDAFTGVGEQISNSIWSSMMHWFYETVYNAVADFFTQMGNMGAEIFDLRLVQSTVWLFTLFGWALFAAGVVVAVFDLAIEYQNGRANVKTTVLNILKGFFACSLIGIVPVKLYKFCISLQNTFAEDLSRLFADGKTYDLAGQSMAILEKQFSLQDQAMGSLFNLLILIAFAYCIIKVFFQNIKRGGILLVQNEAAAADKELARLLTDPGNTGGGTLLMPNMTSPESVNCFAAIVDFLVSRYSRDAGSYGRVAHWIVLNEVDGGSSWANMGTRPQYFYTDYYIKVMRLVNNILRQYDQNAETFASFTHSWTLPALDFPAKEMIETIDAMGKKEGDYRWALACHSYPWDLLDPRCWECPYSTPSMDTQCVSFRNLEVLDKWIRMPEHKYLGTQKRSVWLSEAGLNSRSYSEWDLKEQAAGTAFAWKKVQALEGIDGWQWHNWFDNTGDGAGAMLGLRKYREDNDGEAKPAWYVFQAAGTEDEDAEFAQWLEYLGLSGWDEIMYDESAIL